MSQFVVSHAGGKVNLEIAGVGTIRLSPKAARQLAKAFEKHAEAAGKQAKMVGSWLDEIKKDLGL